MSGYNKSQFYRALIISDDLYPESKEKIETFGIRIYSSFCNTNVSKPLWKHADMQIVQLGDKYICAPESYGYYKNIFDIYNLNLIKGNTELSSNYPYDIAYNITVTESKAVHNFKYTDTILKKNLSELDCIDVSQGYSRCSLCVVDDNKFITADKGMSDVMKKAGCNIMDIRPGFVELPGYDYGFLGGSSFKLGDNIIAVNGNIDTHPDSEKIRVFCKMAGVELISLSEQSLMDIGSAIVIR